MPKQPWSQADEISDRIIDLMNERIRQGVDPLQLYAGLLLGLIGFMRTAPQPRPATFNAVGQAAQNCLEDLIQ